MKAIFEDAVAAKRFSMPSVYRSVKEQLFEDPQLGEYLQKYERVVEVFGKRDAKKIVQGLLRFAFFIEPVKKPKIETTKYAVRWGPELSNGDPRRASYAMCLRIFEHLLDELVGAIQYEAERGIVKGYADHKLVPYELPIDYVERCMDALMHRVENVGWFWGDLPSRVIALRAYLLDSDRHGFAEFFKAAYAKVKVKTHLTDRVLTGLYKTNREKRWETHPASVHFARRKDCLQIEATLINQLCYFQGFPAKLQQKLEAKELISFAVLEDPGLSSFDDQVMRCPITLQPLSFEEFKQEVLDPEHGKASYQVGHMHPLKATTENPYVGHTAKNISWISVQGNRIQGEYSVEETRALIYQIIGNYKSAGLAE